MITNIRLVNCQSWSDCTIDLSKGFNVIVAPNNTGKSVLFKILKITASPNFYKAKKRRKLIRWGCTDAKALYAFDSGAQAVVIIQPNNVIYGYRETCDAKWRMTYEPAPELIKEIGLLVNNKGNFIANIIDTDQDLLLVDSDAKGTYEFIDLLCNDAQLMTCKEKLIYLQNAMNSDYTNALCMNLDYADELKKYAYVDVESLENSLSVTQVVNDSLFKFIDIANLVKITEPLSASWLDFDSLLKECSILQSLESLDLGSTTVPNYDSDLECMISLLETLENIKLADLSIPEEPIGSEELFILECFETLNLQSVFTGSAPVNIEGCDTLETLELISSAVASLEEQSKKACAIQNEINLLNNEFLNSGEIHSCDIFKKVVYDGNSCIPVEE